MLAFSWLSVYMGAFVFAASYGLYYAALRKGLDLSDDEDENADELSDKWGSDDKWGGEAQTRNPFLKHWLNFGGGYYGTVAFVELVILEYKEVQEFAANWQGLTHFFDSLGLNTLIAFLVEQFQNFIAAVIWPTYYLGKFSIVQCGIFVLLTYAAFEVAKKLAYARADKPFKPGKGESYSG